MGKMSSLATAYSGLKAAQAGLYVTGHNISNVETPGYVRQRTLQKDVKYQTYGVTYSGKMQVGLGTDIYGIRQIRDKFLDISYRKEASKLGFHDTKATIGREIETIIGELQSDYRMEAIISDMRDALNELSIYQPGLETRGNFIATCTTFLNKVNNVYDRMFDYMHNLDDQIVGCVSDINDYLDQINSLNTVISVAEQSGDNANDYRDERNLLMDQLSLLIPVSYTEVNKQIRIMCEGKELLANGNVSHIGLKYSSKGYYFVEPIITESKEILQYDTPINQYRSLFDLTGPVDTSHDNDTGKLKALLACRGYAPANYSSNAKPPNPSDYIGDDLGYQTAYKEYQKMRFNEEHSFIPRLMKDYDTIVHSIVTLINDAVSPYIEDSANPGQYIKDPDAPFGLNGAQYDEIFVRRYMDRFDGNDYNDEDPDNFYSLYTIGNIMLNPLFTNTDGYNNIALSLSGDQEDTRVIFDVLQKWADKIIPVRGGLTMTINEAYQVFVNSLAVETSDSINYADRQASLLVEVDNKRQMISGVSMDEELENMMIFNRAYGAASRVVNLIDGMLDRIINNMGRAGL